MLHSYRLLSAGFLTALLTLCLAALPAALRAQTSADVVVPVTVTTDESAPSIALAWTNPANVTQITVARKLITETEWSLLAQLTANYTSFTDETVEVGTPYEYLVLQQAAGSTPSQRIGLVYAGIKVEPVTSGRGKVLLVVDSTLSVPLSAELTRLADDLRGDGWQPIRRTILVSSSNVASVKELIKGLYQNDPNNTVAAFLIGDIPVPYSGNIAPDGHVPDHQGAWPTDFYYGDMDDDEWTDGGVNTTAAARPQNRNVPNDGKFDQSQTPTLPEIVVSRVDFSNLTGWGVNPVELYRRYLNKDHRFRTGAFKPQDKVLVDDNFGYFSGEAFAQSGWRNGYALVGQANTVEGDFFNDTDNNSYLLAYGCGAGSYTSAAGVGTSDNFKTDSVNAVFSLLFGSYHGDWDYETNPFMPSALASKGSILTCSWAGRPNWTLHHMAMGEPILSSTYWVWLNSFLTSPVYPTNYGADLVHVGMLGDPTLRAHSVIPPTNLLAKAACGQPGVEVSWTASADASEGYLVYRSNAAAGPFQLISASPVTGTTFTDATPLVGQNFYQVKALKLQVVPTGSYYNQSLAGSTSLNYAGSGLPLVSSAAATPVACFGTTTGDVTLTVSGGGGSYTYLWSNMASGANLTDVAAGTYTVTVTDVAGCTTTTSATVTEPAQLEVSTEGSPVSCFGGTNGTLSVTVQGGTGSYQIVWSANGQTGPTATNLAAGIYAVTVTDAAGCSVITETSVGEPSLALGAQPSISNLTCANTGDGAVSLSVTGGTGPYTFDWDDLPGSTNSKDRAGLEPGGYTVTISDTRQCTTVVEANVTAPAAIVTETATTNAACAGGAGGTVTLTVSGGAGNFTFLWSNEAITQNLPDVSSGDYTVTVTDDSGCTVTTTAAVQENTTLVTEAIATDLACNGDANGKVSVTITGGLADYTILWSNEATSTSIENLAGGTYSVTVTDAAGCTQSATAVVLEPAALTAVAEFEYTFPCPPNALGNVGVSANGGTVPYSVKWNTGATTPVLNDVPAGIYTVIVTDENGCSTTVSNTLTEIPPLELTFETFPATCFGTATGSIDVTASGGNGSYTYAWAGGVATEDRSNLAAGTYTLTLTDIEGCVIDASMVITQPAQIIVNITGVSSCVSGQASLTANATGGSGANYTFKWSNQANTPTIAQLSPGTYTVTVTDGNGCTRTNSATVTLASGPTGTVNIVNLACNGVNDGTATAVATNGTAPYNYVWSNGGMTQSIGFLEPGTYTVTITDFNGCTSTASGTVDSPLALSTTSIVSNVSCFGGDNGSISLTVTGGTPTYFFDWADLPGSNNPQNRTGLTAGLYTVVTTDENGCAVQNVMGVGEPALPNFGIAGTDTACLDQPTQYALPGFSNYQWSASQNGTVVAGQGTANVTVLWATTGLNEVVVTFDDANNCTYSDTLTLFVDLCVGTQEPTLDGVTLWPNPFTEALTVQFEEPLSLSARLRVYDVRGRLVLDQQPGAVSTLTLHTAPLAAGTYFLQVVDQQRAGVWKVVKM